jgi:hypothetical protein
MVAPWELEVLLAAYFSAPTKEEAEALKVLQAKLQKDTDEIIRKNK